MRRVPILIVAVLAFGFAAAAGAPSLGAQGCKDSIGHTITAVSFDEAVRPFANLTPKSEFETTAQFDSRVAAALGAQSGGVMVIAKKPDQTRFKFDADRELLTIEQKALFGEFVGFSDAFLTAGVELRAGTTNIGAFISETEERTGVYLAKNSYGAEFEVTKLLKDVYSVFDRELPGREGTSFSLGTLFGLDSLRVDAEQAKLLKTSMTAAYIVRPRSPFFVTSELRGSPSSIRPNDITLRHHILIAEIQCGLLLDGAGKVLVAYPPIR